MPFKDTIEKFYGQLVDAGVTEESAAFTSGKLTSQIVEEVMKHVEDTLGAEKMAEIEELDPAEQEEKIEKYYQELTGKTVAEYRDQLADQKLAEFEAA